MTVQIARSIEEVPAAEWDALCPPDNPFVEHAFLRLLEESGCVGPKKSAWEPRHIVVRDASGALLAAAPTYLRGDSNGEYIFDWGWANAASRAGIDYYPKITCAVPFTPATGPRLLAAADPGHAHARTIAGALRELCAKEKASSVHVLFCREEEAAVLADEKFLRRASLQLHWRNDGYTSFDDFLSRLNHEDRKNIRRERRRVHESGLRIETLTGTQVDRKLWPTLFQLYASIYERKWGRPYLNRRFFERIPDVLGDRAIVALARRASDGDVRAMTLSFEKGRHLYGRYWGAFDDVPGLHFELCYYQLIERAITQKLALVEAGAQGEHKLKRAFLPCVTHSAHHIVNDNLRTLVTRFLREEAKSVAAEQTDLLAHAPFKAGAAPKHPLVAGVDLR